MKKELITYIIEAAAGKGLTIFDIDENIFTKNTIPLCTDEEKKQSYIDFLRLILTTFIPKIKLDYSMILDMSDSDSNDKTKPINKNNNIIFGLKLIKIKKI